MEDEAGGDEKILAVPIDKITPVHRAVRTYKDVPELDLARIAHFFEHYKDLEPDKWVKVIGWGGPDEAHRLIMASIERLKTQPKGG
jgi:inorganic pyrophosphatase